MDPSHLPTPRGWQSEQQDQNVHPPHETLTSTSLDMYTHTCQFDAHLANNMLH